MTSVCHGDSLAANFSLAPCTLKKEIFSYLLPHRRSKVKTQKGVLCGEENRKQQTFLKYGSGSY
jgi:hypothetical protein